MEKKPRRFGPVAEKAAAHLLEKASAANRQRSVKAAYRKLASTEWGRLILDDIKAYTGAGQISDVAVTTTGAINMEGTLHNAALRSVYRYIIKNCEPENKE